MTPDFKAKILDKVSQLNRDVYVAKQHEETSRIITELYQEVIKCEDSIAVLQRSLERAYEQINEANARSRENMKLV